MVTLAPHMLLNNAGLAPAQSGLAGFAGNVAGPGQFESILENILGTTAEGALPQTAQPAEQGPAAGAQPASLAQLDAIMQKLQQALGHNAQRSSAGQADMLRALQEALAPVEIASLQAALQMSSPQAVSPAAPGINAAEGTVIGWTPDWSQEIAAGLNMIEQVIAGITGILEQSGTGQPEMPVPDAAGRQEIPNADLQKMLLALAQLRDALLAAQTELMAKAGGINASPEAGPGLSVPQDGHAGRAAGDLPQAFQTTGAPAPAAADQGQTKPMLLSPEDLLTLRPGPQGGADGEGLWADELPADTLQALKDAGGLSSQGGFAESGRQGSLYSLALLSKAGLLSAYQQGRAAQQPTAGFLSDLELMKVFAEHSQEAEQGPLLSQLHSMAEAEGKIAGAGRAGRQASAAENILPTEEGAQAQTGQSAKAEPTLKPLASGQTNQAAVLSQVVERIVIGLRRNESRLSLQIHPPSLGKVNIDLAVRNNQLRAVIFAETAQAKMLLDANLDQLKACLESQNLDVEKVSVEVGSDDRQFASLLREQREQERRHVPASGSDLEEACQALPADNDTRVSIYDAYRGSRSTVDLFA